MFDSVINTLALEILEYSVLLFVFVIGVVALILIYMYITDVTQSKQTIRKNYPIVGRLRYQFEHLGEFFRQYFFAMDREELPFNRAQRSWVYRASKNMDSTIAFGSTRQLNQPGEIIFLNNIFPVQSQDAKPPADVTLGEGFAQKPYTTNSIINISGMSFGAISKPAVLALSSGAKKAGIWMNTGEGGLSPYHLAGGCDIVFQIGTAKYGVRDEDGNLSDEKLKTIAAHEQVRMFEIKMSQGAKPGKGGILPAVKVTAEIAEIRGIPIASDSISPNGHLDIKSIEDLQNMIARVRKVTGKPVGIKSVIGQSGWLDELCDAIHQRGLEYAPDFITIDSADGGTGAAPQSLMDAMGIPLKRSLPLVVDKLIENSLRERIKVICSGKLLNPSEAAWAFAMGADFVVSARGFMFALGCIQALQCNKNTCPTGITTHNKKFQKGLNPVYKTDRVANFAINLAQEVKVLAHSCGAAEPRQMHRGHIQIINSQGIPENMDEVYPTPIPKF